MGLVSEFKSFAMRGNVVDLAVGVIIGASFGKIVSSIVDDIIMPPIGVAIGGVSFRDLKLEIKAAVAEAAGQAAMPAVSINYGNFLQTILDFLIIAMAVFAIIKLMNSMKKKEEAAPAAPPAPSKEELLLAEIRDAIRARGV
jgi:large conductance mechanosensitive channel